MELYGIMRFSYGPALYQEILAILRTVGCCARGTFLAFLKVALLAYALCKLYRTVFHLIKRVVDSTEKKVTVEPEGRDID